MSQDRRFIDKYMPDLGAWLHYRTVDVSTIKELTRRWYPQVRMGLTILIRPYLYFRCLKQLRRKVETIELLGILKIALKSSSITEKKSSNNNALLTSSYTNALVHGANL